MLLINAFNQTEVTTLFSTTLLVLKDSERIRQSEKRKKNIRKRSLKKRVRESKKEVYPTEFMLE